MGREIDDVPFPPRRPKVKKSSGSSGKGNGTVVGMAILLLALPVGTILACILYIAHGYNLI